MSKALIARRYAKALLDLAVEQQSLAAVRADLLDLAALLQQSPELAWLVRASPMNTQDKDGRLRALFDGRAHPLTIRFLRFLNARHRLNGLDTMLAVFEELCDARTGVVRVRITSARPLAEDQLAALKERIISAPALFSGLRHKSMQTEQRVDPALLGGFRVQIGDFVRDLSLASQLEGLKQRWLAAPGT